MGKRLNIVWNFISHNKYWIVAIIGILIVGVFDENSILQRMKYEMQIHDLKEQIKVYNAQYDRDEATLRDLKLNPENYSRIARERYMMKTDDEDIFVLSDDARLKNGIYETAE